ncbi:nucleotidyltransferase [Nibricoccus aquaticus]|uniref:Nucleotidyltransferase n=1 Tax=Nibricoccus aquaticus TaxID=2576891 RepID=A0A290Q5W8_9BACT|nr:sugar phosphate nucleotidyltransferase [Nibricoccus aquaticus]ATC63884.1 nucleotidyltransferase [Nibricoccus aquaticus]
MQPALLVLAAGMGSRYGGLKQIDPVGPHGETILDYSVFDALRAGFTRVVFVIRRDFEELFREKIGAKYTGRLAVDYVFQSTDALPPGYTVPATREKPWGTGHATWCAKDALRDQPFAVINADDFYGADSFAKLADFLARARPDEAAMAGFQLARTLSENGAVSRGLCDLAPGNILRSVTEHTGILPTEVGEGKKYAPTATVSMNCWAFTPQIFPLLDARFRAFLETTPPESLAAKAEFYLPAAISALICEEKLRVRVLSTESDWFGVTYREDRPHVVTALNALIATGAYPAKLF